ncbi:MAG: glycosyltransferase family 39 protein [Acidobacteriia bacterium]|nr:glycosyltransferase family 39 protein [Terriglobia bacterium]
MTRQKRKSSKSKATHHVEARIEERKLVRIEIILLVCILALAGGLRVYHLGQSPLWMNVDEGATAWNSYCLLKTGMDQHGVRWPIFDSAGFGQGMTTLYLYMLIPFQAIGGLNVITSRAPAAMCGVLMVFLIYYVGKRLFDRWVGIAAAGLLALSPWHLQQSRWGHMANLFPLIALAPLAVMLWAGFPGADDGSRPLRPWQALLAGAVTGVGCYGFYGARLWIPVFCTAFVLVNWRAWWGRLKTRPGVLATAAFLLMVLLTFGPLVWASVRLPLVMKRAEVTWVWNPSDAFMTKIEKVVARYPGHFGPGFLFQRGDTDVTLSPPAGYGLFHWYTLPMMLAGLAYVFPRLRRSSSARVLLTWVALYPAADLLNDHPTMHALRSLPGAAALSLTAAVGLIFLLRRSWHWHRQWTVVLAMVAALFILITTMRFNLAFFGDFNADPIRYQVSHRDLVEACAWLKPRLQDEDAVFVTRTGMLHPYIYTLVGLQYDPRQWFRDPKTFEEGRLPNGTFRNEEMCLRYGKLHFIFGEASRREIDQLVKNGRGNRVVFIMRPGELQLGSRVSPVRQIRDPEGNLSLVIYEFTI